MAKTINLGYKGYIQLQKLKEKGYCSISSPYLSHEDAEDLKGLKTNDVVTLLFAKSLVSVRFHSSAFTVYGYWNARSPRWEFVFYRPEL